MATTTVKWYGNTPKAFFNKEIDLLDDDIRVMLTSSSYAVDQDADDYYNDVTNEVTGTNWAANGQSIANDTLTYTGASNVMKYDGDDVSVSNTTLSGVDRIVIYDRTPATDATRPLIGFGTLSATVNTSAGTLTITWDSAGILTLTAA